mgnify:CR=1 FL=1
MQVRDVDCHDSAAGSRVCRVEQQVRDVDYCVPVFHVLVFRTPVGMQVRDVDCHR